MQFFLLVELFSSLMDKKYSLPLIFTYLFLYPTIPPPCPQNATVLPTSRNSFNEAWRLLIINERHLLQQLEGPTHTTIPPLWRELLMHLYSARYLQPRRRLPFSTDLKDQVLSLYPKDRIKAIIRVEPEQLNRMARILWGNNVFRQNSHEPALEQIIIEIKVTLFRLGMEELHVEHVAFIFGISIGSVHNCTWRCIFAIEALADQYATWPNE